MNNKKVLKILKNNGFLLARKKGSHFIFIRENNHISIPIHKGKDIHRGMLKRLFKENNINI